MRQSVTLASLVASGFTAFLVVTTVLDRLRF
jgi:hypothetical protein